MINAPVGKLFKEVQGQDVLSLSHRIRLSISLPRRSQSSNFQLTCPAFKTIIVVLPGRLRGFQELFLQGEKPTAAPPDPPVSTSLFLKSQKSRHCVFCAMHVKRRNGTYWRRSSQLEGWRRASQTATITTSS